MPIEAHGGSVYANLCLESAARLLSDGYNLNIFPEGAYIDDKEHVYKGRTGAARILFLSREKGIKANIVPVSIDISSTDMDLDSYDLNRDDIVNVNILEPLDYEEAYYNYENSSNFEEKNNSLHMIIDDGMRSIAKSLNREYIDSYIELYPKGNVIFKNGEKIDTTTANQDTYVSSYKQSIEERAKLLIKS